MKITDLRSFKDELYSKYNYLFSKSEYDDISLKVIEEIKRSKISRNIDLVFIERLNSKVYLYIKSFKKDKNKYLSLISSFIDNNFKLYNSYKDILEELKKVIRFLRLIDFSDKPMTLEKIGNLLKITRERVRQIESRALKKIINSSSIKEFAFYMDNPDQTLANLQNIRNFYNKGGNKKIKIQDSKTTDTKQVKRIKTIYELLNGFKKEEINLVIKNLSPNYKHLLELRYGNDLDNPVTSPEWNINLAHNFYRNLIPKMRRELMENRENNSVDIKVSLKDLLLRMDIKDVIIICLKDGYFNKTYSDVHLKKYLFVSDEDINHALNKLNVSKGIRNEECLEEIDIEHLTELKGMNLINSLCNLSVAEFIVLTLLMGYANGYYYKINEISALLQVDEETVSKILKSALIKFREEINKMIKGPVKKLNLDK